MLDDKSSLGGGARVWPPVVELLDASERIPSAREMDYRSAGRQVELCFGLLGIGVRCPAMC